MGTAFQTGLDTAAPPPRAGRGREDKHRFCPKGLLPTKRPGCGSEVWTQGAPWDGTLLSLPKPSPHQCTPASSGGSSPEPAAQLLGCGTVGVGARSRGLGVLREEPGGDADGSRGRIPVQLHATAQGRLPQAVNAPGVERGQVQQPRDPNTGADRDHAGGARHTQNPGRWAWHRLQTRNT